MKITFDYGFVIPLETEAKFIIKELKIEKRLKLGQRQILIASFNKIKLALIISGCGKIKTSSATQLLIDYFNPKILVNFGTAGAIAPHLKIGDIVCPTSVIEHDVKLLFPKPLPPPNHFTQKKIINRLKKEGLFFGPIVSGDCDVVDSDIKNEIFNKYQALSVDWESAAFLLTCNLNHKKAIIFRVISDLAHEKTSLEYEINEEKVIKKLTKKIISIIEILS